MIFEHKRKPEVWVRKGEEDISMSSWLRQV